jgi:antitoxin PrlF
MITSKLTHEGRTTIPRAVRIALRLRLGDALAYQIENGSVVLTRLAAPTRLDDPFATFAEWNSPADTQAYKNL